MNETWKNSRHSRRRRRWVAALSALAGVLIFCTAAWAVSVVWTRTVNGPADGDDRAWGVVLEPTTENLYVVGQIESLGDETNIWIRKYTTRGTRLWTRIISGPAGSYDVAYEGALDSAGNFYAVGKIDVAVGEANIWIRKFSPTGTKLWTRKVNGLPLPNDRAMAAAIDGSDHLYVVGQRAVAAGNTDIWIRKYDSSGTRLWTRWAAGSDGSYDGAQGAAVDGDGNLYVVGFITPSGGTKDIWIRKYDSAGTKLWTRRVDGPASGSDVGRAVAVDPDGYLYVVGYVNVLDEQSNIWIRKYTSSGSRLWTRVVDGPANFFDSASDVAVDENGALYVIGGRDRESVWIRKYSPDGVRQWTTTYTGPYGYAWGNGIAVTPTGRIYAAGVVQKASADYDIWLRQYLQ